MNKPTTFSTRSGSKPNFERLRTSRYSSMISGAYKGVTIPSAIASRTRAVAESSCFVRSAATMTLVSMTANMLTLTPLPCAHAAPRQFQRLFPRQKVRRARPPAAHEWPTLPHVCKMPLKERSSQKGSRAPSCISEETCGLPSRYPSPAFQKYQKLHPSMDDPPELGLMTVRT